MKTCRVCGAGLGVPVFKAPPASITSVCTLIPESAIVYCCQRCGHAQSPNLPSIERFYDTEYRISLATDGFDQLYDLIDECPIFRVEHQARLVTEACALGPGARVLDYGAAKAESLRRLANHIPGIECCVFDVSRDYQSNWHEWIPSDRQAVYEIPISWERSFDLVTACFVLEHVAEPVEVLTAIARLLKPNGKVFILVPDAISNPGDLVVVDHVNHFTESSLHNLCVAAGLKLDVLERNKYRGAFLAVAGLDTGGIAKAAPLVLARDCSDIQEIAAFWTGATKIIAREAASPGPGKLAIYGAGFYGTFIAAAVKGRATVSCFVDRNPFVRLAPHLGLPVMDPDHLPLDISTVFAGLNPKIARDVLDRWKVEIGRPDLKIVYLDDAEDREVS